ncbi:MAG: rhomboid family intramembrane serine protease [Dysgonomonas sp.]
MADFINNIKVRFKSGDILIKLIFINIAIFLLIGIFNVFCTLFKISAFDLEYYVGVPAIVSKAISRPWTFITYMFVHANLWHILFNMLMLYWFGRIFLSYFNQKNLGSLYILGGIGGAILYIIAFNTIPYYTDMKNSILVGASASVMAVIFASAFYRQDAKVGILFFGQIKIIYIAVVIFLLDFLALGSPENPGGHIAHIGGALVGFVFAKQYLRGRDITRWLNRLIDWFVDLFKKNPHRKLKVKKNVYKSEREADYDYNQRKHKTEEEIDIILDKIKSSGYSSLTKEEKKRLFDASKK